MQSEQDDNELHESDVDAQLETAVDLFREGRLRQARRICEKVLQREQRAIAVQILAKVAQKQGRFGEAAEGYQQFLRMVPEHADSHLRLGIVHAESGQAEAAVEHLETAIRLDPESDTAFRYLGDAYFARGYWDRAIAAYAEGLERLPDDAILNAHLGVALQQLGRLHAAVACFYRAVNLQPDYSEPHINLARALMQLGRADDAIAPLERAIEADAGNTEAQMGLAMAYRQLGRVDDAAANLDRLLQGCPDLGEAHHQLSIVKPDPGQIAVIQEVLRDQELNNMDSVHCHFALGNLLQREQEFDEAFKHFESTNAQFRKSINHDAEQFSESVDGLISLYSAEFFEERRGFGSKSELPVFIVGLPRSGTTLVDQIVSSHPDVHAAGELDAIRGINYVVAREQGYDIDAEAAATHADAFLEELRRHSSSAIRITDKLPSNYLAIGLIKTLLPKARIVHCERGALDTCFSLYSHFLPLMTCSFEQTELGRHYRDYQRLMVHWNDVFADEIFTVRYEDLVANQESESRNLIDYVGLDWDDACLDFPNNERNVSTPSNIDVRQSIYSSSVGRWKSYESHLQPLVEALGAETN